MELLDFYTKNLKIDPIIPEQVVLDYIEYCKTLSQSGDWRLELLYYIFTRAMSDIQTYRNGHIDYFKPVSGNKIIWSPHYAGVIDLWFPSEIYFFDLAGNPILAGWIIEEVIKKTGLEDISSISKSSASLIQGVFDDLTRNILPSQEFYGFYLGDQRRSDRKRGIKIRRLRVEEAKLQIGTYYGYHWPIDVKLKDQNSGEILELDRYKNRGWHFYLSESLLTEKLEELETLWMRNYDKRVEDLDNRISVKRKELERLIKERKSFMNGITEYRNKLRKILGWKDC